MSHKNKYKCIHQIIYLFLVKAVLPLTSRIFVKKVNNPESLDKRAFIVASNHASLLDPIILTSVFFLKFNKKLYFIAKEDVFENPLIRLAQEAWGTIQLYKKDKGKSALEAAERYLRNGKIICIFPEGERSYDGKLIKPKTGVARLAISSRMPVLPVAIKGTHKLMARGTIIPKLKKEVAINIGNFMHFDKYHKKKVSKNQYRLITNKIVKNIKVLMK